MAEKVLITGLSGFIAKHIAVNLFARGYRIRGTVRDLAVATPLVETLVKHGCDREALELLQADLDQEDGWAEAINDVNYVVHVASPFPLQQPTDRMALVPAARDGALRVLGAVQAVGERVRRVVMTSSIAAMMYRAQRPRDLHMGEDDWTDIEWERVTPYIVSKTAAEKAAWRWARENGFEGRFTTVNPGFVLGPALDAKASTSIDAIKLMFRGAYPAVPPIHFPVVDVRDLAELHAAALTADGVGGRRLIAAADTLAMAEMAGILKREFPEQGRKIPTKTLPVLAVRILALFDRTLGTVLADLNCVPHVDNRYVTELTGVRFRPARDAVVAAGQSLVDLGVV